MTIRTLGVVTLLVCSVIGTFYAETTIPSLNQRVTDLTNTLTYQEWKMLERILKEFEDSTSTQIAILIIPTLEKESIEEYTQKVFKENRIGQQGKNNGVLVVVAKDDHKIRIEVGYGLEGVLTDALASRIIRNEMLPHFRDENYFAGLVNGIDAIIRATAGEYKADAEKNAGDGFLLILLVLVVFFLFFVPLISSRRRRIIGSGPSIYYSGWGLGGWHGGIGGGFRSSGWSGGGGLSGGGGATGSW